MLKDIFCVGLGSCLGGICRYLMALALKGVSALFPWATLATNIVGCLLIGVLMALFNKMPNASAHLYLLLSVGFCGGFTTFSTFSKEGLCLLQTGNYSSFLFYALGSLILGVAAVAAGFALAK